MLPIWGILLLLVANQILKCQVEELLARLLLSSHLIQNTLDQYLLLALSLVVFRWAQADLVLLLRISEWCGCLCVIRRMKICLLLVASCTIFRIEPL